jgi:hypothetical protein
MYGLLFGMIGLALGTLAGIVIGARYVRAENIQQQIDETQARMLAMMNEMRATLVETRGQVRSAWTSATTRGAAPGAGEVDAVDAVGGTPGAPTPSGVARSAGSTPAGAPGGAPSRP